MKEPLNNNNDSRLIVVDLFPSSVSSVEGLKDFDCGNEIINRYVANSLKPAVKKGDCAAKIIVDTENSIVGFCTYSLYSLGKDRVKGVFETSLPKDVGVLRLVMLGVDKNHHKKSYGINLMQEFFDTALKINQIVPIKGVYLDADAAAVPFYKRLGFVDIEPSNSSGLTTSFPLFLKMESLLNV